ncbi:LptF/LptG family permease [soil metagenome]
MVAMNAKGSRGRLSLPFTVDRYVASKVLLPLAATFGIGLVFLLAERVIGLFDNVVGKANMLVSVFEMLAYLSPYYVGLAIPVALFLGVLLGFSRMSQDNEIDALLASGIGLHRLSVPIVYLSIASLVASIAVLGWLQPHGRYAYRSVVYTLRNVEVFYLAEEGVFMQAGNRTFIFDRLDRENSKAHNVFIYEDNPSGGMSTLTASEGQIIGTGEGARPILRLQQGQVLKIDPPAANATEPPKAVVSEFTTADTPIGRLSDKIFRPRGIDERELTLSELISNPKPPADSSEGAMRAELHSRIVRILTIPILPFLAIPFALARNRNHRTYNIGAALLLLVAFNQFIEQGTIATRVNSASPWLTIWLPFALILVFTAYRFWKACFAIRRNASDFRLSWKDIRAAAWPSRTG